MSFLFFQNLGMIVGHVYTEKSYFIITVPVWKSTLLVIGVWNIIFWGPQSLAVAHVIFADIIYGYFNFGFGLYLNILTVPLPCLFDEVKLCQAGLVLG